MISLCFFKRKKGREEKKWKGKLKLLDLYIWTMSYYFRKQSVLTHHISWVKLHSVPLSNWACIQLLKRFSQKKKKKKYSIDDEKKTIAYLTSLHYSHDTNSYAKFNRHYKENFDSFKQIYNWSKQPQYNYIHYIDLVEKLK